jgi:hypothetical protein
MGSIHYKDYFLGHFKTDREAALAYDAAARRLMVDPTLNFDEAGK